MILSKKQIELYNLAGGERMKINKRMVELFMAKKQLSRCDVAKVLQKSPQSLDMMLSDRVKKNTPKTVGLLASALGVDVEEIIL